MWNGHARQCEGNKTKKKTKKAHSRDGKGGKGRLPEEVLREWGIGTQVQLAAGVLMSLSPANCFPVSLDSLIPP